MPSHTEEITTEQLEWLAVWGECWELMADTFTHSKPSPNALKIYAARLTDISADRLRAVVEQCIATCRFFPTIADLRDAAGVLADGRGETAMDAWEEVRAYISEAGRGGFYEWRNPLAERVATAMGLWALRTSSNSGTDRAHFLQAYREAEERERAKRAVVPAARAALPESERLQLEAGPESTGVGAMRRLACKVCNASGMLPATVDLEAFACPSCARKAREAAMHAAAVRTGPPPTVQSRQVLRSIGTAAKPMPPPSEPLRTCGECGLEYRGDRPCPRCQMKGWTS